MEQGHTPLHCAVMRGHHDAALLLISRGGDAHAPNDSPLRQTPIELATCHGQLLVIELMAAAEAHRRASAKTTRRTESVELSRERELAALKATRCELEAKLTARRMELQTQEENHALVMERRALQRAAAKQAQTRARNSASTSRVPRHAQSAPRPMLPPLSTAQSRSSESGALSVV